MVVQEGKPLKLTPRWSGKFKILHQLGSSTYLVINEDSHLHHNFTFGPDLSNQILFLQHEKINSKSSVVNKRRTLA